MSSFINRSNRTKYKRNKRFFSSKSLKDLRSSRKFCRKTMVNLKSEIKFWVEKNSSFEKKMKTLYINPKTKHLIFEMKNIHQIKKLLIDYNYIQSLQVIKILPSFKTRIVQQNLPHDIERLQCFFMESFLIKILAVYKISNLSLSTISGVDGKCFPSLNVKLKQYLNQQFTKTKYDKSGKLFRLKKSFPKKNCTNY
jgi:hypothetical protein